jgi:signal transduction histidine kinase
MQDGLNVNEITLSQEASEYEEQVLANNQNPISAVFNALVNIGTNAVDHHNQQKYIRITNFLALNTFIGSFIYLSIALIWDKWYWLSSTASLCILSLVVIGLNALGNINVSRIIFVLSVNSLVFVNALLAGPTASIQNYFMVFVIVPLLIYDIKEVGVVLFGVLLPALLIYFYDFTYPLFREHHFLLEQQLILHKIGVVIQMLLTLLGVYQLARYSKITEADLEASNAQMMLQTAELKRSNSDLEQFAYIISHDLKTPVRNISSFMNLLMNKHSAALNAEAREFVGYSHQGAKRLERLIDDVLAYCRIGTNLPRPIPVNLNDVVNTIRFEMRERLASVNGRININKELPQVNNVHASLIYHIFQNLISNGLKFNKNANPEININWTNSLNYYTFSIHDNGIGISQEYSSTIFQMFKRLHNETEYDGTGIGLAICKKIVEYYHGEIWFDSSKEKGTTFYFTIRKF